MTEERTAARCRFCTAPITFSGYAWLDAAGIAECLNGASWYARRAHIDASHEPSPSSERSTS